MSVLEVFCDVDDFMLSFAPHLKATQIAAGKQRQRPGQLWPSEIMTILIHFHQSHYRTFKAYYTEHVHVYLTSECPHLVSYTRIVALIPGMLVPLLAYLQSRYGDCTGISFIDSTSLSVCDPKRIHQHRVFAADARRGKSSMGWFFGFKLHLAVNDQGELLACSLTPGNVDDRAPVPQMVQRLRGKLIGDRGSISASLTELLFEQGLQLITRLRKNRKNHLMHLSDKLLVRKRAIIESIIDQLKNISQIEHSRHRSPTNFVVHLIAGLLAYSHQAKKPGLHLDQRVLLAA
ncbi:MAG TPA: IS982 family transposase [Ktedonobacteraceae bacterium]